MTTNNIRRFLIILNVFAYIFLVIIGALTDRIYISLLSLIVAALWAVNLYLFDKYENKGGDWYGDN